VTEPPRTPVTTVTGVVDAADLGVTLTHEHLVNDVTSWSHETESTGWDPADLRQRPVTTDILWDLKHDPFANLDNCRLDDPALAVHEVSRYAELGGHTIMEATGLGIGRDLQALARISEATGVRIIAGTGFYLESSMPADARAADADWFAQQILRDLTEGDHGVRPGFIGEIGVSADFTVAEQRSLRGAFLAQRETGLPVQVHLPGWFRRGGEVLDLADEVGVPLDAVVLCHMGPSGEDLDYQLGLLDRGAWLQYDMIGMEVFYADQGVQCPSDEENAAWIVRLCELGHADRILMSQDVFLKSLLRRHGGPGYGHLLQYFVPRLRRHGLADTDIAHLTVTNPRTLFERAHEGVRP